MFICDSCRVKKYTNGPSIRGSYGRCEICEVEQECSDIPSFALREKSKTKLRCIRGGKRGKRDAPKR